MSKLGVISPKALKELVRNGGEYAILDIRDQGIYYDRHLLLASCLPIGRLELDLERLVPRKTTPIILVDETVTDEIKNVAHQMEQMGYSDVEVLEGGLKNWEAHGYELYSGINVPSKAFGEFIEHSENTPRISAQDLEKKFARTKISSFLIAARWKNLTKSVSRPALIAPVENWFIERLIFPKTQTHSS